MLEINSLSSYYGGAQILFDLDLQLANFEITGLFGRNGVGKTTTFRSIMGLTPPRCTGEILYNGENILGLPPYIIARKGIGFVPEDRRIFPNLTVRKNLWVGQKKGEGRSKTWDIDRVFDFFPQLKELESHLGMQLSGGEQQMLTIGRTLMGSPHLLLLDEPTEGLAPLIAKEVMKMVLNVKQSHSMSVVVIEQFSPHVLDHVDTCYVMERGRIAYKGEPQEIKNDYALQKKLLGVGTV